VDHSLAKNPYIIVRGYWRPGSTAGCKQGPLDGCLFLTSQVMCLRESAGKLHVQFGRRTRLARKRASSDPTIQIGICRIGTESASLHCWRVTGDLCLHTLYACLEAD